MLILGLSFQEWRVGRQALPREKKCLLNTQEKSTGASGLVFKTVLTAHAGVGPLLLLAPKCWDTGTPNMPSQEMVHVQNKDLILRLKPLLYLTLYHFFTMLSISSCCYELTAKPHLEMLFLSNLKWKTNC